MSLITCKECGKEISDQAAVCPNCGAPTELNIKREEAKIKQTVKEDYNTYLAAFRKKITRLIIISLSLGLLFFMVGAFIPSVSGKIITFFAWIVTILVMYKWLIKENRSFFGSILKVLLVAFPLLFIIGITILIGSTFGTVGAIVVIALWVIAIIAVILYPIFDIVKDVKTLKSLKESSK